MIGKQISHYKVISRLGTGGMGVVYAADDTLLGRRVAIKCLRHEISADNICLERFRREAIAASSLNHPNICTVHDFGEYDGNPFMIMEFLEGTTLRQLLMRGRLEINRALTIAAQIASALEAAHQRGIIHRDIKPANIFLTGNNQIKLLDFGLAKDCSLEEMMADDDTIMPEERGGSSAHPIHDTGILGTVAYMAPEQAKADRLDHRADLFSLGAVLYEMVTGKKAFGGKTAAIAFSALLNDTPQDPQDLNPAIPVALCRIISRLLQKLPRERYQQCSEIINDLENIALKATRQLELPALAN